MTRKHASLSLTIAIYSGTCIRLKATLLKEKKVNTFSQSHFVFPYIFNGLSPSLLKVNTVFRSRGVDFIHIPLNLRNGSR